MSEQDPDGRVVELADLNTRTVRERNDHVDSHIAQLEDRISDLEDEKADLKAALSETESDRDGYKEALEAFRDNKRTEAIASIEAAAETLLPDEADINTEQFSDLDADVVSEVADVLGTAAEAQQNVPSVPQNEANPDVSSVQPDDDGLTDDALAAAEEIGMAEELQKLEAGEKLAESGPKTDLRDGGNTAGAGVQQGGVSGGAGQQGAQAQGKLEQLLNAVDGNQGGV